VDLIAAPLVVGGDVIRPFEIDVGGPMRVTWQACEKQ